MTARTRQSTVGARVDFPVDAFAEVNPASARLLLLAAVERFAERGYYGTTTRDIANVVGMSPAGVYVHYRSKEDLLFEICRTGHEDVQRALQAAADATGDPAARLRALVHTLTVWHAKNHLVGRVVQLEMRALSPERFAELSPTRRAINASFREALEAGVASGCFTVPNVVGVATALVSLCTDVARWYHSERRSSEDELADLYVELATRIVGLDPAGSS